MPTQHRTEGRLNFKGDVRTTIQPRVYDTAHGVMVGESVSYDEDTDLTTLHLVEHPMGVRPVNAPEVTA